MQHCDGISLSVVALLCTVWFCLGISVCHAWASHRQDRQRKYQYPTTDAGTETETEELTLSFNSPKTE